LNITDRFTDGIILTVISLVIISVSVSRHYIVCLFESHFNSIGNCINKKLHVISLFGLFYSFYCDWIPSVYTNDIFSSMFTDGVSDGKI
jgi:hypothetical protein